MPSRSNKTWLIPLAIGVWEHTPADEAPPFVDHDEFEIWLSAELGRRGYHAGLPRDLLHSLEGADGGYADANFRDFTTVNTEAQRLQIGLRVLQRAGATGDVRHDVMLLFAALGHAVERTDLGRAALQALDDEEADARDAEARVRARSELAAALGQAVTDRAVGADDPLLGHPFHEILIYHEAQLFGRLAWVIARARNHPGGRPAEADLMRPLGIARAAVVQTISACISMAVADGELDNDERRLVNALFKAARLGDAEVAMLLDEIANPETPAQLAAEITHPTMRHFVLRLLLLTIHVNGQYHRRERAFFEDLARRFGANEAMLETYEIEAIANYEHHTTLFGDLSLASVVGRMRARLNDRIEHAVSSNARKLHDEINETGELGQLLIKAGETQLTDEERAKVRQQLIDVARAIPALAIFAAPGGAVLLPLLIKHLPFKLLPSNFDTTDEILIPPGLRELQPPTGHQQACETHSSL